MRIYCWYCHEPVSSELPKDTLFKAIAVCADCADCIEKSLEAKEHPFTTSNKEEKVEGEASIIVNGNLLTSAQSVVIRVALEGFSSELVRNGLGGDEHGVQMKKLYLDTITEIRGVLYV